MKITLLLITAIIFFFYLRNRHSKKLNQSLPEPDHQYHAVSICCKKTACKAALTLQGKPYLSAETPRLPLGDCDLATCHCYYKHLDDRRDEDDRRFNYGMSQSGQASDNNDRRINADRRKE